MLIRKIATLCLPVLFSLCVCAQDSTTTYKSDQWINLNKYGNLVLAMNNPVREKVVIVQGEESFKVTLGQKVMLYKIVKIEPYNDSQTRYTTTMNGKKYLLNVTVLPNDQYSVGADNDKETGEWMVYPISQVSRQAPAKTRQNGQ